MKDISIFQYKPESKLIVEQHEVIKPKFPVIDFHTHYRKDDDAVVYITILNCYNKSVIFRYYLSYYIIYLTLNKVFCRGLEVK